MFLMLGAAPVAVHASDPPMSASWVPADVAIYVEILRPDVLFDRLEDDGFRAVTSAIPAYGKALRGEQLQQLRAVAEVISGSLGKTPAVALRDLTGGGAMLAVERENRACLVIRPRDSELLDRAHAKLVELARKDANDKGKPDPFQPTDYRGFSCFSTSPQEAHAIVRGNLVIATGTETLRAVIDRALEPGNGTALADHAEWKTRRQALSDDTAAWSFVRLDRLRTLDPKRFALEGPPNAGLTILFGPWFEAVRKSDWAAAALTWKADRIALDLNLPKPKDGYTKGLDRYLPPRGTGAPALLAPPGTIANLGLWRDWSAIWEVRADLLPPMDIQNLAQLDTFAGQFFGGRDFGSGVLGALASDWRLVIARQDPATLDPVPDDKLPAFALVIGLRPDDEEFAQRLQAAFQSFIGLANIGAAQNKAPPLILGSEAVGGVTIATSHYLPAKDRPRNEPVHRRHNFSPSSALVGNTFILGSSIGLVRDLVKAVQKKNGTTAEATLVAQADGSELAKLIEQNHMQLVSRNMLEKGNDHDQAEASINGLAQLVRYLGRATVTAHDVPAGPIFRIEFALGSTRP
jgi:hypothetical protein